MNTTTLHTEYLRASRSIDTVALSNNNGIEQLMYIYNYEGYSYRIFESLTDLLAFFQEGKEPRWHFESEEEVERWMERQS